MVIVILAFGTVIICQILEVLLVPRKGERSDD